MNSEPKKCLKYTKITLKSIKPLIKYGRVISKLSPLSFSMLEKSLLSEILVPTNSLTENFLSPSNSVSNYPNLITIHLHKDNGIALSDWLPTSFSGFPFQHLICSWNEFIWPLTNDLYPVWKLNYLQLVPDFTTPV